jgi:hypothetical protein
VYVNPSCASDVASVGYVIGTLDGASTGFSWADSYAFSNTSGSGWANATAEGRGTVTTNTPYLASVFDGNADCRFVSGILRVRFTGSALNTSGSFMSLIDKSGAMHDDSDNNSLTMTNMVNRILANPNTVRTQVVKEHAFDLVIQGDDSWSVAYNPAMNPANTNQSYGAGQTYLLQNSPSAYFVFTESSGSSTGVSVDLEMIENWEFVSQTTAALATPSPASTTIAHSLKQITSAAHAQHAITGGHGKTSFLKVAKGVISAQKSHRVQGVEESVLTSVAMSLI